LARLPGVTIFSGGDQATIGIRLAGWAGNWVKEAGVFSSLPVPDKDVPMTSKDGKVVIEVDSRYEVIVRRAMAMAEEMEQLALTAADGRVVHECETAVIEKGRQLQSQLLSEAVARRIEAAEKKGLRFGPVRVDTKRKTKAPKNANS
jgi:hypothetical protein